MENLKPLLRKKRNRNISNEYEDSRELKQEKRVYIMICQDIIIRKYVFTLLEKSPDTRICNVSALESI